MSNIKNNTGVSIFDDSFNDIIFPGDIPSSLTGVRFGKSFNQKLSLGVLPENLQGLCFGESFNQKLDIGVIPPKVVILLLGKSFNKKLKPGVIPNSVKHLGMRYSFNQKIEPGDIPEGVTYLKCGGVGYENFLKENVLPQTLTHFNIFIGKNNPDNFPFDKIKYLKNLRRLKIEYDDENNNTNCLFYEF